MDKGNAKQISHTQMMKDIYQIRGCIINEHILLERMIDTYLSKIFSKDKATSLQLRDWVFTERIPAESKIQILRLVIDKHNPHFNVKHKSYAKDILKITEVRNVLAHYLFINDGEALELYRNERVLQFAKFKNDSKVVLLTPKDIKDVTDLIIKYNPIFMDLAQKAG